LKNPTKPDSNHHLGIAIPEFLAANTIGMITYGISPDHSTSRGRAVAPVRENVADLVLAPEVDGARVLASQVQVLNALFNRYTQISMALLESGKPGWEPALHLALRAQNECRRSVATLNELRNPKKTAVFIKKNIERQQNNLVVEGKGDAQMDVGSATAAVGANQNLEALGGFDGGKVR